MSAAHSSVVAIGELQWVTIEGERRCGGDALPFLRAARQLGAEALLGSRVGCDADGAQLCEELQALGLDPRLVQRDDAHPTGAASCRRSRTGVLWETQPADAAWDWIAAERDLREAAGRADVVWFDTLVQRKSSSHETAQRVCRESPRSYHVLALRLHQSYYTPSLVRESLAQAHCVHLTLPEARILMALLQLGPFDPRKLASDLLPPPRSGAPRSSSVCLEEPGSCWWVHSTRGVEQLALDPSSSISPEEQSALLLATFALESAQGAPPDQAFRQAAATVRRPCVRRP